MAGLPRRQGLGRGCDGTEVQTHGHKDGCRTACTRSWEGRCGVGAFGFPPSRTRLVLGEQRSTARHGSWTAAGKPHLCCREPRERSTSRKKESEQLRSGQDEARELTSVPVRDQAGIAGLERHGFGGPSRGKQTRAASGEVESRARSLI